MATAPRKGLNSSRKVGSAPDNKALSPYKIASGYGTALGIGDPVKIHTDGTIVKATNGADAIGVFHSVSYTDSQGNVIITKYWPASTVATNIEALVMDDPLCTYNAVCAGPIAEALTFPGALYALNLSAADAATGRSTVTVNNVAVRTGALAVTGTNNAALAGLANNDAFTIKSSVADVAGTITIVTNQTPAQLLALLNAVPGISAALNGSNFLVVTATDGGNIVLADGAGTPLADSTLLGAAGTVTATVAAGSAGVKIVRVIDVENKVVEVVQSRHSMRDDD